MRERLIAAFVGLTVLTITLFAVVRAYSVSDVLEDAEQTHLDGSVALMADLVGERVRDGDTITTSFLQRQLSDGEHIEYDTSEGETVAATTNGYDAGGGAENDLSRTRLVAGGGAVTLARSTAEVQSRVADTVLQIALVGIFLVVLSGILGFFAARHLSRPFRDLARLAGEFGRGRFEVEVPHYVIPEAEEIGIAMREAQREVTGLVSREREFAANASHRLRTPITALRLALEDLTLWPQTHPDVAAELTHAVTELDRLTTTVIDLLVLARDRRVESAGEIDLCAVIADSASRWRPLVHSTGRKLVSLTPGQVAVRVAPGPVAQILDVLIDNALKHGSGVISLTVAALDTHVRVQVSDQGEAAINDEVFRRKLDVRPRNADRVGESRRRDGISLSVATEIAEALGGYLRLEPETASTFTLMVPRSRPPG